MIRLSRFLALTLLVLITACSLTAQAQQIPSQPTATALRFLPVTPVPTLDRQPHPVPTTPPQEVPPEDSAMPEIINCESESLPARPQHTVTVDLDYTARALVAQQMVQYPNRTGEPLNQIVMNIEPTRWEGAFALQTVTLGEDGLGVGYELLGRRLRVDLPEALPADCSIRLRLTFAIQIPPVGEGQDGFQGYFGYTGRQVNLGHWLPTTAVILDGEWVTREALHIGEQDVLESADWDVTLNITHVPESLRVAAPGDILESGPESWHFRLAAAREFPVSMSDQFIFASSETEGGTTVELYSFDDALIPAGGGVIDSAAYALDVATKAITLYSELFGPYPYERLEVVQADFPDGMELSGLVFVGGGYFRNFGGPTSYLMMITVHEVSHQWWYARVGTDQAFSPWLDEALATYSEYVFVEEYYPDLKDWWWDFRVDSLAPEGFVDDPVYKFQTRRAYINAVYLRGVRMIRDLRADLGTDAFFSWLRRYADAGAGRVVTPGFFWSLLTPDQMAATEATRARYMRQPQIIIIQTP
ncbi:MAG: M1 family metallopeptidase [Anaerolineaceae bacterium]|nr:M1 family metallopeptidase [Anaerolineaceae bacterium]